MGFRFKTIAIALGALVVVGGCTKSHYRELTGGGKYSPDESEVRENQALALPPSLQLPSPSNSSQVAAANGPEPKSLFAPEKVTTAPPDYGQADPNEAPAIPAYDNSQLAAAAPQEPLEPAAPPPPDIYEQNGISKVHEDGTPKTKAELIDELRKKAVEAKRQENPNYGTVFNSSGLWGD